MLSPKIRTIKENANSKIIMPYILEIRVWNIVLYLTTKYAGKRVNNEYATISTTEANLYVFKINKKVEMNNSATENVSIKT